MFSSGCYAVHDSSPMHQSGTMAKCWEAELRGTGEDGKKEGGGGGMGDGGG